MELPKSTDIELQLALLRAIALCSDSTAVAEELRPVVAKVLSLIIPEDQKDEWTNLISWALIDMRDRSKWLTSLWYENPLESQQWIKDHRPDHNQHQRIWKISEEGKKILIEGYTPPPADSKKDPRRVPVNRKNGGNITYEDANECMWEYYLKHKDKLPNNINKYRELIIQFIMNGMSSEEAFSTALKSAV